MDTKYRGIAYEVSERRGQGWMVLIDDDEGGVELGPFRTRQEAEQEGQNRIDREFEDYTREDLP